MRLVNEVSRIAWKIAIGPFEYQSRSRNLALALIAVVLLTFVTQIGGLVLWLSIGVVNARAVRNRILSNLGVVAIFALFYGGATFLVVPPLAKMAGRVPLPCLAKPDRALEASTIFFCIANRNYVKPSLAVLIEKVSRNVAARYPGTITTYLDAGFPFGPWFPLIPHLSHRDGAKIDLTLFYIGENRQPLPRGGVWGFGYFAFQPADRLDQINQCAGRAGLLRWDVALIQGWFDNVALDLDRTRYLITTLAASPFVTKLFLEPRITTALGAPSPKIRFAGCGAARHDDHVHVDIGSN